MRVSAGGDAEALQVLESPAGQAWLSFVQNLKRRKPRAYLSCRDEAVTILVKHFEGFAQLFFVVMVL